MNRLRRLSDAAQHRFDSTRAMRWSGIVAIPSGASILGAFSQPAWVAFGSTLLASGVAAVLASAHLSAVQRHEIAATNARRVEASRMLAARLHATANHDGQHFGRSVLVERANVRGHSFCGALMDHARWHHAELEDCDFTGASMAGTHLVGCIGAAATFGDAVLDGARLEGLFSGADFTGASCHSADMRRAVLDGSKFASAPGRTTYLTRCDFSGSSALDGVDYSRAEAEGTRFAACKIYGAAFRETFLCSASFENADVIGCDFRGAMLADAQGTRAATFGNARLGDEFTIPETATSLAETWLIGVDLSRVAELDSVDLSGALANAGTRFPDGFDAAKNGALLLHTMTPEAAVNAMRHWTAQHGRPPGWVA